MSRHRFAEAFIRSFQLLISDFPERLEALQEEFAALGSEPIPEEQLTEPLDLSNPLIHELEHIIKLTNVLKKATVKDSLDSKTLACVLAAEEFGTALRRIFKLFYDNPNNLKELLTNECLTWINRELAERCPYQIRLAKHFVELAAEWDEEAEKD